MNTSDPDYTAPEAYQLHYIAENSGWVCELFGCGPMGITFSPRKGDVPNWFWRWMQYICFGNKWRKL